MAANQPTDHRPTDHGPVSLEEAATRLGVTANAVRQRLKRGTLNGHKTPDGWVVVWPPTRATGRTADHSGVIDADWSPADRPTNGDRPTDQEPTADQPSTAVTASARSQLAAIWTEWLGPLTARNEALARENGELRAERDAAAAERDWLRSERDRDHRLADQLVDLLQADRDEAWARVAALEGAPGPPADAGLVLVPAAGVLGRVVGTIGRAVTAARSRR